MLNQLRFYATHSLNDLRTNGQRTFFALLCIAAGVAAIVSLQTLAGMIQNTLTVNLQESNRGDMQISTANANSGSEDADNAMLKAAQDGFLLADELSFGGGQGTQYYFSDKGEKALADWFAQNYPASQITYRQNVANFIALFTGSGVGVVLRVPATQVEISGAAPVMVESDTYPFYGTVTTLDGKSLADVLNDPTDMVLSVQAAETLKVSVGDTLQIDGVEPAFTVRGIVPTEAEVRNPTQDILAALNGFYILDVRSRTLFPNLDVKADSIYIKLPENTDVVAVEKALGESFKYVRSTTTEDLRRNYTALSDNINKLVTVMGLIALLLGSVGIINTMQVIVRRRIIEIAVLKTIGLQANQITQLFLFEAFLMGVIGSFFGVLLGWFLVFVIRGVAEGVFGQPLPFVFAPNAVVAGIVVGTLVTTVFGFIPTLSAGQVRPATVLRPDDSPLPRAGRFRTFLALIFTIIALSLVASTIVGDVRQSFAIIIGAFIMAGVLYLLLLLLIWLIGRFLPSFGIIDLKIALREMLVTKSRGAITLLALVVGVFSLSLITLLADSVSSSIGQLFLSGENVYIQVGGGEDGLTQVSDIIAKLPGENTYSVNRTYNFDVQKIVKSDGSEWSLDEISTQLQATDPLKQFQPTPTGELTEEQIRRQEAFKSRRLREFVSRVGSVGVLTPADIPDLSTISFVSGRQFKADDSGNYIVISANDTITDLGLVPGDKLVFQYSYGGFLGIGATTGEVTYEILGIAPQPTTGGLSQSFNQILQSALPANLPPSQISIAANIQDDQISVLRRALTAVPQTFLLETAAINRLFTAILGQFTAFPLLVALLGLVVGGIVIANSVALSTMERRREIAIMKSLGLQRERVLGMLLLENSLLGLIGGLLGVGLGLIGLLILLQGAAVAIPIGTAFALMFMCIVVALVAALTTAWGASGEKPLNVLRYE